MSKATPVKFQINWRSPYTGSPQIYDLGLLRGFFALFLAISWEPFNLQGCKATQNVQNGHIRYGSSIYCTSRAYSFGDMSKKLYFCLTFLIVFSENPDFFICMEGFKENLTFLNEFGIIHSHSKKHGSLLQSNYHYSVHTWDDLMTMCCWEVGRSLALGAVLSCLSLFAVTVIPCFVRSASMKYEAQRHYLFTGQASNLRSFLGIKATYC